MPSKRNSGKKPAKGSKGRKTPKAYAIIKSPRSTDKARIAAIASDPLAVCESDDHLQAVLEILRDKEESPDVRYTALQTLAAAAFNVVAFEPCRRDYIATLRKVATDPDLELRQRVLGALVREKDGFAQKKLLEGLEDPAKALVPPEKALQLLGYDVHADAYAAARKIVAAPPNAEAKREALRLLSADAHSAPLFEKVLRDKGEATDHRQIAAAALHALKPKKLQEYARDIVLDATEHHDIRATSLTALSQFGDHAAMAGDQPLVASVKKMGEETEGKTKACAHQLLHKLNQ